MGLRYFFDRNSAHIYWLRTRGWHPPIATEVIMAVSLAAMCVSFHVAMSRLLTNLAISCRPLLAFAQYRIFKQPFKRVRSQSMSSRLSIDEEEDDITITNRPSEAAEKEALAKNVEPSDETPVATPVITVDELLSPKEDTPFKLKMGRKPSSSR